MNSKWHARLAVLGCFLAAALLLTWGETYIVLKKTLPNQTSWIEIAENQGSVCFDLTGSSTTLRGYVAAENVDLDYPVYDIQNQGRVLVDEVGHRILAQSRFVMVKFVEKYIINDLGRVYRDGPSIPFNLGPVAKGVYSIWLGDLKIGQIAIPFGRANAIMCVQTKPDAIYRVYNGLQASYSAPYYIEPTIGPTPIPHFQNSNLYPYPYNASPTPNLPLYYPPPTK